MWALLHSGNRAPRLTVGVDTREYPTGIKITVEGMDELAITMSNFNGEWNDALHSRRRA